MKHKATTFTFILFILWYLPVSADMPDGAAYLDGGTIKSGLILCHGRGKNPTWKVVDPLRKGAHEKLGFHTLSIQMPNNDKYWKEYPKDFPEAYNRIKEAIRFLKQEKGVNKIFLMGHSMGGRMASAYLAQNGEDDVAGLIIAGCRNNGGGVLNCMDNLQDLHLPTLDIWGGGSHKDVDAANEREIFQSDTYTQIEIPAANHKFDDYETEFVDAVLEWIKIK